MTPNNDIDSSEYLLSGVLSFASLRFLYKINGPAAIESALKSIGLDLDAEKILCDKSAWFNPSIISSLFQAIAYVTGNPNIAEDIGKNHMKLHEETGIADILHSLGSPAEVFKNSKNLISKYSTYIDVDVLEIGKSHAILRCKSRSSAADPHICNFQKGVYSQIPVIFGLVPAVITETECQAKGSPFCLYSIAWEEKQWSAFVDEGMSLFSAGWNEDSVSEAEAQLNLTPDEKIEQLREQVESLTMRLASAYETAGKVLNSEDIDSILTTIIQNAGAAVNAPRYLIWVRPFADEPPRLQYHGFSAAEAVEIESELSAGIIDTRGGTRMTVPVASARKAYGYLLSATNGRATFFPNDKVTLEVYAGYAATALDVTTALEEARRRDATARSLLEFSTLLTNATCKNDVIELLGKTIVTALGAAGSVVLLYDDKSEELYEVNRFMPNAGENSLPQEIRVKISSVPSFKKLVEEKQPVVLSVQDADPINTRILSNWNLGALVVAPMITEDRLIGTIHAGFLKVGDTGPNITSDMRERLMGIANQATTGLINAELLEQIRHMAWHDSLTGLPNRRLFEERANQELKRLQRSNGALTIFFVDLDRFKQINDSLGHAAGDALLCEVARRLEGSVRKQDTVARLGGDEFAILLPGLDDPEIINKLGDRVLQALNTTFFLGDQKVVSSGSIGITTTRGRTDISYDDFLREADLAMYQSKSLGRNTFQKFNEEMTAEANQRWIRAMELKPAIERGELFLVYQAQIEMSSMQITGVEALVRWKHPKLGELLPNAFLPAAEESGDIFALDMWVMDHALKQLHKWDQMGLPKISISINLTSGDLFNSELIPNILRSLEENEIEPSRLEIEISTKVVRQIEATKPIINNIRQLGVRVAIDNVVLEGSIPTSLEEYDISTLKVDSYPHSVSPEPQQTSGDQKSVIEVADDMGLQLVGEKVETNEQKQVLMKAGVKVMQGMLFSPPVDEDGITQMLKATAVRVDSDTKEIADSPSLK